MKLRNIPIAFDETVRLGGVGAALFFIMLELTYINSKSLLYLDRDNGFIAHLFAIIGSLAYSLVTITVMRHPGHLGFKRTFPVFDTLLVFCGFNINLPAEIMHGNVNFVALALSIFLSCFTGLITFTLGMLNFEQHGSVEHDQQMEDLKSQFAKLQSQIAQLQTDLQFSQTELVKKETDMAKLQTDIASVQGQFANSQTELAKYQSQFVKSELSRIRKKRPENRDENEKKFMEKYGVAA